jgi:hypothetical protein
MSLPGLTTFELYREYTAVNTVEKPFEFNMRFEVVQGERWFGDGDLDFCVPESAEREYYTVYGPVFASRTMHYRVDDRGLRGAVRRLTCVREVEIPDLHFDLKESQDTFPLRRRSLVQRWQSHLRRELRIIIPCSPDTEGDRSDWVHQTHPKRVQRENWYRGHEDDGGWYTRRNWAEKGVNYVCKPGETLAEGKYLRAIGDLGVAAAGLGGYYMDWLKAAFEIPYIVFGCEAKFIKTPDKEVLKGVFADLMDCRHRLVMRFFSDDSCIAMRCDDGVFLCNMDISACDGSNYDSIFQVLLGSLPSDIHKRELRKVFAQLREKCRIRSTQSRKQVVLRPLHHTLYSGSTLTTSVNNMAEIFMFLAMVATLPPRLTRVECPTFLQAAAADAGFLVKVQACQFPEDLQFLKHSPHTSLGEFYPVLNAGVLLRNFGTCWGDLPGRQAQGLHRRAATYTSDVVRSYVHAGKTQLFDAFRETFVISSTAEGCRDPHYLSATAKRGSGYADKSIDPESFALRYRVSTSEVEEFIFILRHLGVGERYSSPLVDRILAVDYGYQPV